VTNIITKGATPTTYGYDFVEHGEDAIRFIGAYNCSIDGRFKSNSDKWITTDANKMIKRSILESGDSIFCIVGNTIGSSFKVTRDILPANINQNVALIRPDQKKINEDFLHYYLRSTYIQWQVQQEASIQAQPSLSLQQIGNFKINVPPLPEQIKIAEILSTWDNAINTVQKLLSNSQQQKKALMQQLLTGKKRFSGFEGEWEEKRLGDVCSPQQWPTISSKDLVSNGYSVYGANGFIGYYFEYNHKNETVAVTCRGSTCGEVSLIPEKSYVTGNSMCLDDVNEKRYAYRYLYYFLKNRGFNDVISGSAQPQIVGSAIRKVKVLIPSLPEQQKIATILTTADQEIDNLRAQLNHLKQEKKALMQQLLTGKRRVKIEEAA
jgi:type I restriction enzyme S subunit